MLNLGHHGNVYGSFPHGAGVVVLWSHLVLFHQGVDHHGYTAEHGHEAGGHGEPERPAQGVDVKPRHPGPVLSYHHGEHTHGHSEAGG